MNGINVDGDGDDDDVDCPLHEASYFSSYSDIISSNNVSWKRLMNNFANSKNQCLGKRDKSSAGRLDAGAVEICAVLNEREAYYTTSSCAGRCFLYTGEGIKATDTFHRCRVSHDGIANAQRYFNLSTIAVDGTGGGDPILQEYDGGRRQRQRDSLISRLEVSPDDDNDDDENLMGDRANAPETREEEMADGYIPSDHESSSWWLRYEPFILHVACRSLSAASTLMATARPTFKNVGLTTFNETKFLVAIWGDEGLDMPLTTADGTSLVVLSADGKTGPSAQQRPGLDASWLAELVNERHERNACKIERFVQAVRDMSQINDDVVQTLFPGHSNEAYNDDTTTNLGVKIPRSYDVIGDVAMIHALSTDDPDEQKEIGEAILLKNKSIKIVALRRSNLGGSERAPGLGGIQILAGSTTRNPLLTTHREYGISCVVDLHNTFFSPRMGPERLRLCQQTARGEHVLVLFAGVCMDALQMAARTEAATVTAIELNDIAVECGRKAHKLLERNKQGIKCSGAAERLQIIHGDCLEVLPTLPRDHYHRILVPRPKEGDVDGDQPHELDKTVAGGNSGGADFLTALLPTLKRDGGECHWYDFCADHEFPHCERTRTFLAGFCRDLGLSFEVLHVANAGSVAKRQLRVCVDFRVRPVD